MGPIGGPSDARNFSIVDAFVINYALKVCQSTKMMTMDAAVALISIKYLSFNSNGSSCTVLKDVLMVAVYWSTCVSSRRALSVSRCTSSLSSREC